MFCGRQALDKLWEFFAQVLLSLNKNFFISKIDIIAINQLIQFLDILAQKMTNSIKEIGIHRYSGCYNNI